MWFGLEVCDLATVGGVNVVQSAMDAGTASGTNAISDMDVVGSNSGATALPIPMHDEPAAAHIPKQNAGTQEPSAPAVAGNAPPTSSQGRRTLCGAAVEELRRSCCGGDVALVESGRDNAGRMLFTVRVITLWSGSLSDGSFVTFIIA
jgi:hypothetical protein